MGQSGNIRRRRLTQFGRQDLDSRRKWVGPLLQHRTGDSKARRQTCQPIGERQKPIRAERFETARRPALEVLCYDITPLRIARN